MQSVENSTAPPADDHIEEEPRYRLKEAHADNPYIWTFDLCRVTLANFRYHNMSLVRDYDALIGQQRMSGAFDEVFRLAPRNATNAPKQGLPLEERFDVLTADPTQAAAVARARCRRDIHHSRTSGHWKIPNDFEFDCRLRRAEKTRAVCLRKASGHRCCLFASQPARTGRPLLPDSRFPSGQEGICLWS